MKTYFGLATMLLFSALALGQAAEGKRFHGDYVPDEKTAVNIGYAVLVSHFGEASVKAQLPLRAYKSVGGFWIVQGGPNPPDRTGGGMAIWINAHSGCIENIFAHMK